MKRYVDTQRNQSVTGRAVSWTGMLKHRFLTCIRKYGMLAGCMILVLNLSGCKLGNTQVMVGGDFSDNEVFKMKDIVCTLPEARVVLTNYQNMYATMYGIDLWNHEFPDNDLEKYVKDLTISRLAQIMAMDFLAEEKGIKLSEEEEGKIKEAAKEYFDSLNDAELEYMHVKQGDIEALYTRYGLANKLYTHLTQGVDDEVSDDEARIMEAQQIFVTDDEKAKTVEKQLKEGSDFLSVANIYNEAPETEVTFGRTDVPPEVEEVAFSLENDQVSDRITTEKGSYFLKCINHYNQEKTDDHKSVILEKRRKEAFDDVYSEFLTTLSSEFNEKVWKEVKVEIKKEVKTDQFFDVYEKHCNW
ncbi:peptidylprolyl isomerase [Eubacterium sp. 14-2]|uniref:peptidylprolyl isomerase n=1 Tax=Eubacterium sp. 14-2 TaxID=1235790 RepID=UPI0003A3B51B|nr:peptidylprolyl isomerase [Eubacterium sp. 14-2]